MNKTAPKLILCLSVSLCTPACTTDQGVTEKPAANTKGSSMQDQSIAKPTTRPAAAPTGFRGKVLETMDSGGYSYVHLDTGETKVWVAGPVATGVTVGQEVSTPGGDLMKNFRSDTLNRVFPEIYFVSTIVAATSTAGNAVGSGAGDAAGDAAGNPHAAPRDAGKVEGVKKAEGGYTVEEIVTKVEELKGKVVKVRGKVVRFSPAIMGTNWAHVQDGSGSGKTGDITVTTDSIVKIGDIVLVEGTLAANKDFGAGYSYAAIIEKAKITKE